MAFWNKAKAVVDQAIDEELELDAWSIADDEAYDSSHESDRAAVVDGSMVNIHGPGSSYSVARYPSEDAAIAAAAAINQG
jgi:hypothetical protein